MALDKAFSPQKDGALKTEWNPQNIFAKTSDGKIVNIRSVIENHIDGPFSCPCCSKELRVKAIDSIHQQPHFSHLPNEACIDYERLKSSGQTRRDVFYKREMELSNAQLENWQDRISALEYVFEFINRDGGRNRVLTPDELHEFFEALPLLDYNDQTWLYEYCRSITCFAPHVDQFIDALNQSACKVLGELVYKNFNYKLDIQRESKNMISVTDKDSDIKIYIKRDNRKMCLSADDVQQAYEDFEKRVKPFLSNVHKACLTKLALDIALGPDAGKNGAKMKFDISGGYEERAGYNPYSHSWYDLPDVKPDDGYLVSRSANPLRLNNVTFSQTARKQSGIPAPSKTQLVLKEFALDDEQLIHFTEQFVAITRSGQDALPKALNMTGIFLLQHQEEITQKCLEITSKVVGKNVDDARIKEYILPIIQSGISDSATYPLLTIENIAQNISNRILLHDGLFLSACSQDIENRCLDIISSNQQIKPNDETRHHIQHELRDALRHPETYPSLDIEDVAQQLAQQLMTSNHFENLCFQSLCEQSGLIIHHGDEHDKNNFFYDENRRCIFVPDSVAFFKWKYYNIRGPLSSFSNCKSNLSSCLKFVSFCNETKIYDILADELSKSGITFRQMEDLCHHEPQIDSLCKALKQYARESCSGERQFQENEFRQMCANFSNRIRNNDLYNERLAYIDDALPTILETITTDYFENHPQYQKYAILYQNNSCREFALKYAETGRFDMLGFQRTICTELDEHCRLCAKLSRDEYLSRVNNAILDKLPGKQALSVHSTDTNKTQIMHTTQYYRAETFNITSLVQNANRGENIFASTKFKCLENWASLKSALHSDEYTELARYCGKILKQMLPEQQSTWPCNISLESNNGLVCITRNGFAEPDLKIASKRILQHCACDTNAINGIAWKCSSLKYCIDQFTRDEITVIKSACEDFFKREIAPAMCRTAGIDTRYSGEYSLIQENDDDIIDEEITDEEL